MALLADEALCGWGDKQPTADHERVKCGPMLHRLEDETETFDIVAATTIAIGALPEGSDALDEGVAPISEEGAVRWEDAVLASAPGPWWVYGWSD